MNLPELARRAGMWVETITLFAQRGLLPAPADPDGYDERHLDIVRFIGRVQQEHHLSLDTIASVLVEECAFDLADSERALVALAEPDPSRAGPGPLTRAALAVRAAAPPELVDELCAAELLPVSGPYSGHHVWILQSTGELLAMGLELTAVVRIGRLALEVARAEVDAAISEVGRRADPADVLADADERRAAVSRLLSASRNAAAAELMERLATAGAGSQKLALDAVHVPSRLFLGRHRIEETLEALRVRAQAVMDGLGADVAELGAWSDSAALCEYGRILVGVGRFEEAVRVLRQATLHPAHAHDGVAWAYYGLTLGILGRDGAVAASERAVASMPGSPRLHAIHAAVLAMEAGRAGDLLMATARIHEALVVIARSRTLTAADKDEAIEALLTRGRLCTVLPSVFGVQEAGIGDLTTVLQWTSAQRDEELGFVVPGSRDLIRVNALFYLGMALADAGREAEAATLLREVIAIDPASTFAARAYERLPRKRG